MKQQYIISDFLAHILNIGHGESTSDILVLYYIVLHRKHWLPVRGDIALVQYSTINNSVGQLAQIWYGMVQ